MRIDLPAQVLLRCNRTALVTAPAEGEPFKLFGHSEYGVELWHRDGKWRESKEPHPLDIVGVAVGGAMVPITDQFARK